MVPAVPTHATRRTPGTVPGALGTDAGTERARREPLEARSGTVGTDSGAKGTVWGPIGNRLSP